MITIDSVVKSKNPRGAIKDPGRVIALFQSEYFIYQCKHDPDYVWGKNYPDWKTKPVALIYFDTPQRTATLEEWIDGAKHNGISNEEARETYESHCPRINQTAFPLDDLEEIPQNPV